MWLRCVTTITRFDGGNRVVIHAGSYRAVTASENASAGHPDGNGGGQQQTQLVREEQSHLFGSLLFVTKRYKASGNLLCLLWRTSVTVQLLVLDPREKLKYEYR